MRRARKIQTPSAVWSSYVTGDRQQDKERVESEEKRRRGHRAEKQGGQKGRHKGSETGEKAEQ